MKVLVINAGSSSLKYQLMETDTKELLAKGLCERIGIDGSIKHSASGKDDYKADITMPDHSAAIGTVLKMLVHPKYGVIKDTSEINAVGHRVVHGAEFFASSVLIDDAVMNALKECIPLAPLHNPANITGINACKAVMGDVPQVAVFDTAFHQTLPPKAFIYALPYKYYTEDKIRRYGFHGTSHRYVSQRAAVLMGRPIEELKLVTCHLGNGSSVSAIKYGKSVETSMGFTPLDGLPMGTRSGSVDSGILEYIMNLEHIDIHQMLNILNKQSGVLGISGISSDFRDLDEAAAKGNARAQLAIDVFCYKVTKRIGSASAAMGGIDGVIFTAGVGENSIDLREKILEGLEFMGLYLDKEKNKVRCKETIISTDDSPVKIMVIPTNEELVIAMDTAEIVKGLKK
ncbi:acetate/propionate family kinase [Papillibacter cinnamivorans]|uniref:Acetate kinase n=1 Tax=Papillibacter cinnamivorans DSM 12816 TaxID=1122930 RepID=A0A1W2BV77_9FIRM|nr:acetate kinase [Papillibacter cinnamivorans]SMC76895.1 acetate kinase [Papillibacter cinnamivorans DSM 12816]